MSNRLSFQFFDADPEAPGMKERMEGAGEAMMEFWRATPVTASLLGFGTVPMGTVRFVDDAFTTTELGAMLRSREGHMFRMGAVFGISHAGENTPWKVNRIAVTVDHMADGVMDSDKYEYLTHRTVIVDMVVSTDMVMGAAIVGAYSDGLEYLLGPEDFDFVGAKKPAAKRKPRRSRKPTQNDSQDAAESG